MVGARGVGVGGLGILTRRSLTGGGGGTADALASGASEGNLVEVQILSAAPAAVYLARVLRAIVAGIVPGRHASGAIYGTLVTAGTILAASEGAQDVVEVGITVVVTL